MIPDEQPILLCRVNVPTVMQEEGFDDWMPKHFDDSLRHPGCIAAANYVVVHDWQRVPAAFQNECTRFISYVADGVDGMKAWIDSPELRAAIADGAEGESKFSALDDERFNGTIIAPAVVDGATGGEFTGKGPILVERFEISDGDAEEFDAWLDGPHLAATGSWGGVVRRRTWRAVPGIPQVWPFVRYQGKGNRMLMVEFVEGTDIRATASTGAVREWLLDSLRWDAHLPYVRRELAENILIRTKADLV
jgi:hypothetical protein